MELGTLPGRTGSLPGPPKRRANGRPIQFAKPVNPIVVAKENARDSTSAPKVSWWICVGSPGLGNGSL